LQPDTGWSLEAIQKCVELSTTVDTFDDAVIHCYHFYTHTDAGRKYPFASHLAYAQRLFSGGKHTAVTITYEQPIQIPGVLSAFVANHIILKQPDGSSKSNLIGPLPNLYFESAQTMLAPYEKQGILPPRPKSYIKEYPQPCHRNQCPWYMLCEIVSDENVREIATIKTWRNR
jgi:hypothetical protein